MDITSLIGNTPLLKVTKIDTGSCELFLKLESQNPGGSIKDRMAVAMVNAAEQAKDIKKGATLVEATAGNTGLGLALVCVDRGYNLVLVVPSKMSQEKIQHLRAMGVEVVVTRSDVNKWDKRHYSNLAQRIATERNAFFINQFENPANPAAHEATTAPEIWQQMNKKLDAIICGVGTGGTLTGLSRYFERVAPKVEMVVADPAGSIITHYVETGEVSKEVGSWLVEGIGEDYIPPVCDLSRVKKSYTITDAESFATARMLLRKEAILGGSSTGCLLAAALKYCLEQEKPKRVVTFVCDTGGRYLTKMYNDHWMRERGFEL